LRHWTVKVVQVHAETKQEIDADIFDKVTYNLHPSFGDRAKQTFRKPPFKAEEDGWGEFEFDMVLTDLSGKDHNVVHDLNFASTRYELKHVIVFKNPKPPLLTILRNSGPIPGESSSVDTGPNGAQNKKRQSGANEEGKKKKRPDGKGIDMDKLADGLQKLGEDDLLQVVQMVHDNKTEESWMRNDVDQGEFHVDLYTLPDNLIKMLWDFTSERVPAS